MERDDRGSVLSFGFSEALLPFRGENAYRGACHSIDLLMDDLTAASGAA